MRIAALALALIALVSCNRDPNVAKQRYLESGNKYFDRGKYKEASIMYRQALQKDQKFGPAHYKLALTSMQLKQVPQAVASLRRAVELLPPTSSEHSDAAVKLSEIYLAVGPQNKQLMQEAGGLIEGLLQRNPGSADGHRLQGDYNFVRARQLVQTDREQAKAMLESAIAEYRKADSLKPNQAVLATALGRSLTARGEMAQAEAAYKRSIELDKKAPVAYFELYALYVVQKRLDEAEALLRAGFQNNPKQHRFLTSLALHYFLLKRRDDMAKVLEELKSHQKEFKDAYVIAGDFYQRLGDSENALRQYRQGIEADADQKPVYQKRIIEVLMRQGKRQEAAQINDQILKENPKDTDAKGMQATMLLERGDVLQAMEDLQRVVTSAPDNFVARYNLGRAHMAKNEIEQARQQFSEAIRLRPDYFPPRLALAQLYIVRREFDMALKTIDEVLARDRNNAGALLLQSAALMGQGKFQDSRKLLETMMKDKPGSSDIWFQLGLVNLAEKRFPDSSAAFEKAWEMNPSNARSLMGVVETYMAQGKIDEAMQRLQSEAAKDPKRGELDLMIGNTAVRTGKFDLAIENYKKLLAKVDPKSRGAADAYLRMGETYRRKGDLASGVTALQKAADVVPNDPVIIGTLALTLEGAGRKDEAKRAYEQVIKLNPNNAIALNNLAMLMADTGEDLNQALTYAQRAKQRLPQIYEVSDTLGWIYLKKNLADNAIEIFRDLVTKAPNHSTYRYHLGMALSQKGDKTNAVRELQQALKNNPPREEAAKIKELLEKLG